MADTRYCLWLSGVTGFIYPFFTITVCDCQVFCSVSVVVLLVSGGTGFISSVVLLLSMTVRWYCCCICGCTITVCGCQVLCSVFVVVLLLSVAVR